jgi:membrane protein
VSTDASTPPQAGAGRRRAPAPDAPGKPDSPTDLTKPAWKFAFRNAVREFMDDHCTDLAAALTYYAVLSIFPALLAAVSLLGVVGQGQRTTDAILGIVQDLGPDSAVETLRGPIESLTSSRAAGLSLGIGVVVAIWSASGYVRAFSRAMNRIYEIDEGRPIGKLTPIQLALTVFAVLLIGDVAVALVVTGPLAKAIGDAIHLGSAAVLAWRIAKWPVLALIVIFVIAVLYHSTPNVKQPKFRWMSAGAFVALVTWVIASVLFGLYVSGFSNYQKTYGVLAGVIIFLLWLWITNLALMFGAEFDSELERSRELQAGMPAATELQLPPRDTSRIEKKQSKDEKARERAEQLRRRSVQDQEASGEDRGRRPGTIDLRNDATAEEVTADGHGQARGNERRA